MITLVLSFFFNSVFSSSGFSEGVAEFETEADDLLSEFLLELIKSASSPSSKASYRKSKIDYAARHDRTIESLKRQIESAKESLKREKS